MPHVTWKAKKENLKSTDVRKRKHTKVETRRARRESSCRSASTRRAGRNPHASFRRPLQILPSTGVAKWNQQNVCDYSDAAIRYFRD